MPLSQSSLRYGLVALLLLVPSITFAHYSVFEFAPFGFVSALTMVPFIISLYFSNKQGGNIRRKIARICLSVLYLSIYILGSFLISMILGFYILYFFMFPWILCPIAGYFAPKRARKIIK